MHTFTRSARHTLAGIATAAVLASTLPQTAFADLTNTAYGIKTPPATSGTYNSAFGFFALGQDSTGGGNTASGALALSANTTGNSNTAAGIFALYGNGQGSYNTAIGSEALYGNTVGSNNTAIGNEALAYSTGNNNIALGDGAGTGITTGSNNIEIGNGGGSSDNNVIRIGSGQTATMIAGIWNTSIPGGVQVYINKYGHLGTATSSQRFKDDIQSIETVSDKLLQLRPVSFRYKQAADDGSRPLQYGLIAEEVAKVYPELVANDADGKPYTVYYNLLTPLMLSELQKEHMANSAQQEKLLAQQAEIESLNQQSSAQRAQVTQLNEQLMAQRAEILLLRQQQVSAMNALQEKLDRLVEVVQAKSVPDASVARVASNR